MTGKRHDFEIGWSVGFDDDGRLRGAAFDLASRCGHSADLSMAINDRAMFHADNAYDLGSGIDQLRARVAIRLVSSERSGATRNPAGAG